MTNSSWTAVAAIIIALVLGGVAAFKEPVVVNVSPSQGEEATVGGQLYENDKKHFFKGLYVGSDDQFEITEAGVLSLSARLNVTGSTTVETFTQGGGIYATTTGTTTLAAYAFDVENMVEITPTNASGVTVTLAASSTLSSFVPNAGDARTVLMCNASSTARVVFAAGAGLNFAQATSSLTLQGAMCASFDFYRATDTDIEVFFDVGQ